MSAAPTIAGAGPDPDTRTPAFKLPPKSCDAHCHIFGPGDRYPYALAAPTRRRTPRWRCSLPCRPSSASTAR